MSSTQFSDSASFEAQEPVQAPFAGEQPAPLPTLPPLAPLSPQPEAPPPAAAPPVPAAPPTGVPVSDMRDVPLGTLVFRAGLLPEERLEEALHDGMRTGKRLGEILLERGWVSEDDLGRLLAGQKGLPFVELDPATIDPTAPPLLHAEKARLHGALPIGFEGGVPVVAVADPSNDLVIENVKRALACEPAFVVAGRDALMRAINHTYGTVVETPTVPTAPAPEPAVVAPLAPPAPVVEPVLAAPPVAPPVPEPVATLPPQPPVETPPAPEIAAPALRLNDSVAEQPQPVENGDGLWLGQPQEAESVETTPVEPAQPVTPTEAEASAWTPSPQAAIVEPEPVLPAAPTMEAIAAPEPPPTTAATWSVVVRLTDGERVDAGNFGDEAQAIEGARGVVAQIAVEGTWPFFAGRFIRPDAIVSVDLVEHEADRWLGSSARAAAWAAGDQPTG